MGYGIGISRDRARLGKICKFYWKPNGKASNPAKLGVLVYACGFKAVYREKNRVEHGTSCAQLRENPTWDG